MPSACENITAVMLSSPYTSQLSHDLAEDMANRLSVRLP